MLIKSRGDEEVVLLTSYSAPAGSGIFLHSRLWVVPFCVDVKFISFRTSITPYICTPRLIQQLTLTARGAQLQGSFFLVLRVVFKSRSSTITEGRLYSQPHLTNIYMA